MKKLLLLLSIFLVSQLAKAQWNFTVTLSASGCGNSMEEKIAWKEAEAQVNYWMGKGHLTFHSKMECEQSRQFVMSESYSVGNCKLRYIASPCTGSGGTSENVDAFGVSKGNSFFSTNGANEIRDWSNDDMERMIALDKDYKPLEPTNVTTGDANYDNARKGIDLSKPFRSLNIDEDAQINTPSADLSNIDVEWQFIKATKKLPYKTIDEFAEKTIQQYSPVLYNVLDLTNMSLSTFEYKLNQSAYDIEGWYNSESIRLTKELENAEKLHDIANFMLQYKGYLSMTYLHSMSDNSAAANDATKTVYGKSRDELAYEKIEEMEKNLIGKYGLSSEDIAKMKKVIDDDSKVQDYALMAKGLKVGEMVDNSKNIIKEGNLFVNSPTASEVANKSITFDKVLDMGVILNNDIALLGLSKEENALESYVQSIILQQKKVKEIRDNETQKIEDLRTFVANNSPDMKNYVSKMSQQEKLRWANNANDVLERVNSRGTEDPYGIFPEKFRNQYIKEDTLIEYRGK